MFPADFRLQIPSASVIQDVNIRLFYDSVAEIMGHTYQAFIMHTILHTIPATNAIAVLWLADPSDFAQRVLMANTRTRIAARLGIINLREAPITTALGDCADSIRSVLSTRVEQMLSVVHVVQGYIPNTSQTHYVLPVKQTRSLSFLQPHAWTAP